MATVEEIMAALKAHVEAQLTPVIENLQVEHLLLTAPTPPSIDVYPGDPFIERNAFGDEWTFYFTVRARVSTVDHEAGQSTLLAMMDPRATTSLTKAIEGTYTVTAEVFDVTVEEGPSPFGIFNDPGSQENRLLGALWRVRVL